MIDAIYLLRTLTRLQNRRLHLGVSGSIACYKAADLLRHLLSAKINVSATLTSGAQHFVKPLLFSSLGASPVYPEMFTGEETFAHLEPGQSCHALLVAPASANLIARMAAGLAQDMLSTQLLAFAGPVGIAPAMNTLMWQNAATQANIATLKSRSVTIIGPDTGELACGSKGQGRLAPMPCLFAEALRLLAPKDMAGETVLVTLGPTREPWDGVRFWSNPSTGAMGASLALSSWLRGARVYAIAGPGIDSDLVPPLPGLELCKVKTAKEMLFKAEGFWPEVTMGMFTAAVADFAPVPYGSGKFKKATSPDGINVSFTPNPDILATLSARRDGKRILGFAAETASDDAELMALARLKLERKGVNVLAANNVRQAGSGFGTGTNAMAVVDRSGRQEHWPLQSKMDVAWDLCTWLLNS